MEHEQEHKSAEHTAASAAGDGTKAAAVSASSGLSDAARRAHLQRKYPTAATQRERYKAVAEEINKFREWEAKIAGKALSKEQQDTVNQRKLMLQVKAAEAKLLRMMMAEQSASAGSAHTPAAAARSSKSLLSNGAASPKPGVAPSRAPTSAELSERIEGKYPTVVEKQTRHAELRKAVDALAGWIGAVKAKSGSLTDDQKRIVKDKEALVESKKREIDLISALIRDQEVKQQKPTKKKKKASTAASAAAAEVKESGLESEGAQAAVDQQAEGAKKPRQEEEMKQQEAEISRPMEVSPTLDDSPSAEPSSSPPVLRSIVEASKPKPAPKPKSTPKAVPVVRSKPAAIAVESKKRKAAVEDEDDVAEPFSPASSPHAMSDGEDEDWVASKKQGGKGAKSKGKAGVKKKAKKESSSASASKGMGRGSSISKARPKLSASSIASAKKGAAKYDPFSFDNLRLDMMPQRKTHKKPGQLLLISRNKK